MLERLKAAVAAFQQGAAENKKEEEKDTPKVEIIGAVHHPEKGVQLNLDWNPEFVEYLRGNGITGADDEVVVQKWITMLFRDMMEETKETLNEYE